MSASDLIIALAASLMGIGFAALIVVLTRVLDTLKILRSEIETLRDQSSPLLSELRSSTVQARDAMHHARSDLARFERVLGSAEVISEAMNKTNRTVRVVLSTPVIKVTAFIAGLWRFAHRLTAKSPRSQSLSRKRNVS